MKIVKDNSLNKIFPKQLVCPTCDSEIIIETFEYYDICLNQKVTDIKTDCLIKNTPLSGHKFGRSICPCCNNEINIPL